MADDDTETWWGGEKAPADQPAPTETTGTDALANSGLTPSDAAMGEFAFNALKPMVEADRQRRAEAEAAPQSPVTGTDTVADSGLTPSDAAMGEFAFNALEPMVEADRQRRAEAEAAPQSPDGDSLPQESSLDDTAGGTTADSDGDMFEDRSPADLDPGFSLPDDGGRSPADLDPGFTVPEHIDFEETDFDVAGDDSGFMDG